MINSFLENRERIYVYLLMLILYSFMVSYAINSISVFLLLIFFFLDHRQNLKNKIKIIRTNKLVLIYMFFFVIQVLGLIYSNNIDFGLRRINVMLPILFMPAILLSEKLDYFKFLKMLNTLKYCIVFVFVYYIIIHVFIEERPLSNFVLYVINDKLGISQFYIMFILLIPMLHCISQIQIKTQVLLNTLFLFLFLFFIILLTNKTSFFTLFLMLLIKGIFLYKFKIGRYRFLLLSFIGLTVFFLAFTPQIKERTDVVLRTMDFDIETIITKNSVTLTNNTLEQRILINYLSFKEIKKHFPFGVGTGDFKDVLFESYKKVNFKRAILGDFNNHNQYMSEFLKTGAFGGVFFLILILMLINFSSIKDNYNIYIVAFFTIANFFESYLYRQHGVLIFSFIIPLFLVLERLSKTDYDKKLYKHV